MNNETSAEATAELTLEIHICDQRRSYRVTFTGPAAETTALAFLARRTSTHAFHEVDGEPLDAFPLVAEFLDPTCEHDMSLSNCYGPQHYYFDDEDQSRGFLNS